jgi:hypothetical protein
MNFNSSYPKFDVLYDGHRATGILYALGLTP